MVAPPDRGLKMTVTHDKKKEKNNSQATVLYIGVATAAYVLQSLLSPSPIPSFVHSIGTQIYFLVGKSYFSLALSIVAFSFSPALNLAVITYDQNTEGSREKLDRDRRVLPRAFNLFFPFQRFSHMVLQSTSFPTFFFFWCE